MASFCGIDIHFEALDGSISGLIRLPREFLAIMAQPPRSRDLVSFEVNRWRTDEAVIIPPESVDPAAPGGDITVATTTWGGVPAPPPLTLERLNATLDALNAQVIATLGVPARLPTFNDRWSSIRERAGRQVELANSIIQGFNRGVRLGTIGRGRAEDLPDPTTGKTPLQIANDLLLEHLSLSQRQDYDREFPFFSCIGNVTHDEYRVSLFRSVNVERLRDGMRFCLITADLETPLPDQILAQKTLIEHDEVRFLRSAKPWPPNRDNF